MSPESWTAVASVGTFLVIAATAIAAIVQLGHLRAANQVAAMQLFATTYEGAELRTAFHFVREELKQHLDDPGFRRELRSGDLDRAKHPEIQICNFFDQWGMYYRSGTIDRRAFMQVNAGVVAAFWDLLEPAIALLADPVEGNLSFQQFEYLTLQARRWLERHPAGDYPPGEERIPMADRWRDSNTQS
jgi:hypothetical protein